MIPQLILIYIYVVKRVIYNYVPIIMLQKINQCQTQYKL
jgi:hypothetical protein